MTFKFEKPSPINQQVYKFKTVHVIFAEVVVADYAPDAGLAGLGILDAHQVLAYTKDRMVFEIEPAFNAMDSNP